MVGQGDPAADHAGVTLGEKDHRQAQDPPDQAGRQDDGQLGGEGGDQAPVQPGQEGEQRGDDRQGQRQGPDPVIQPFDEDAVEVEPLQTGEEDAEQAQEQPGEDQQGQGPPGLTGQGPEPRQDSGWRAARLEIRRGGEGQDDAGEDAVELRRRHRAPSGGGVVELEAGLGHPFEHHEVVHVDEEDGRYGELGQLRRLQALATGLEPQLASGLEQVDRLAPVPGHPAEDPQLLQRHPAPVVGQDHGQGGGAALQGLHLQDGRGAHHPEAGGPGPHRALNQP